MNADVELWYNPDCSTCRTADGVLADRGLSADKVHYLEGTVDRATLERVIGLLDIDDPREMMRTKEPVYDELGLHEADRDALIDAMVAHPVLIQRPIAIRGDRAVIARPPERLLELLE